MAKNTIIWTGDSADAVRDIQTLNNKVIELEDKLKRATAAGKGGLKGLQREAMGMVMSFASVGAMISQVTAALRAMREERTQAAEGARGIEEPRAALAQLAGGSQAELQRMYAAVGASRAQGVSPVAAYNLQWQLEIAGMQKERGLYAGLYPTVADPSQLVGGIRTIRASMGAAETGTTREMLNKLIAASRPSPITIEQFGPTMAAVASGASGLGYSDEDVMATLAMMAEVAPGTGEAQGTMAATRLRAFMKVVEGKGLQAESPLAAARQIEAMGLQGPRLKAWMGGRIEGLYGYRDILRQGGRIEAVSGDIAAAQAGTGGPGDLTTGMLRTHLGDTLNRALAEQRTEAARADLVTEELLAPPQLRREAAGERSRGRGITEGHGPFTRYLRRRGAEAGEAMGLSPAGVELAGDIGGLGRFLPGLPSAGRILFDDLRESAHNLRRLTSRAAQHAETPMRAPPGGEY